MATKKKIGLFFGTFNPVHVGHMIIANYMANYTELTEVWLIVTPQNPHKQKNSLLEDYHRLAMVREAVADNNKLHACNIEFELPKPSYTINTLVHLHERYPEHEFVLIMGEDNLRTFEKWQNHEQIIKHCELYVYPRALTIQEEKDTATGSSNFEHEKVKMHDVPVMKVSASFIRQSIKAKKDVRYLLTEPVYKYVSEMHFYEK
ncbi:nicotinate (nicotinamide) nucleotide adenylyltransferase [Flavobacteriales bacterium]|nr:nicotinate (nicotinamide) nucleotide adenylyltransferase [Flavobacteriales bacterium]